LKLLFVGERGESGIGPEEAMNLANWHTMMIRGRKFIPAIPIFFALFFIFSPGGLAQGLPAIKQEDLREPVRVRADHIAYDKADDSYVAEGNVEIQQGNRKLTADFVSLKASTNEVRAKGNVALVEGEDVLRSEEIKIDLGTNRGIILQGSLFLKKQNFIIRGEEIERQGEETYRVRKGSFTTCEGDWPAWRFTGRDALITLEEYATVHGAAFEIKNIPVLYSPYLIFPVKTKRQSGFLIPRIGYSNTSGLQVDNAFFWAIARNMDATFSLDVATRKGVGEGLEYRYIRKKESASTFLGYHIRENQSFREQRTDQLDRKPDRWQVDLRHDEYFSKTFFVKTRLRGFSDRQYSKDYGTNYEDQSSEQAYSFLSLTKNWERLSFFGEGRHTVDLRQEDKTTLQHYPVLHFLGLRQPIFGSPLYYSFNTVYGSFWREQGISGHQADFHPRLSWPLRRGVIEITPELGGRGTFYATRDGTEETRGRASFDFKTTVATEIYRVFETGFGGGLKLKHLIRPEISYSYVPDTNQQEIPFQIPFYDPPAPKTNAITYGFTQRFIGKVEERPGRTRYHEFIYLKVSQALDLFELNRKLDSSSAPRRPFGAINGEIKIKSLNYFTAENITAYDPNKNRLLSSYSLLGLTDSRGDGLNLEHFWADGTQDQIYGSLRIRLLPSLDVLFGKRYSRIDRQNLETTYGLNFRQQCWAVDLNYTEKPAVAGQLAEKKFMLMLTLVGVTSVGKR